MMKKTLIAAALFAALGTAHAANPATQTFEFTSCLSGACGAVGNSVNSVATLTMESITDGVKFTLLSTTASTAFISGFYMNGSFGSLVWDANEQTYKDFGYSTVSKASTTNPNGYNWDFTFLTGKNKDRFASGENAAWTITGSGVGLEDFATSAKLMVHVNEYTTGNSAKLAGVTAPVPEPETYAMFLAGLGIMGAVARRRKQQA